MPLGEQFYFDFKKLNFTNRSFNYYEILYNIAIAEIMFKNLAKGSKLLKSIVDNLPESDVRQ